MKVLGLCQPGVLTLADECWCRSLCALGMIPRAHLQIQRAESQGMVPPSYGKISDGGCDVHKLVGTEIE